MSTAGVEVDSTVDFQLPVVAEDEFVDGRDTWDGVPAPPAPAPALAQVAATPLLDRVVRPGSVYGVGADGAVRVSESF